MGNMGEIATLTDRLAMMPDQMLPRLAQQYKGDAITLSLILGEKNRRDRVRNAPKMAAQAQPKVNDQIVAGMQAQLPEDVGIGALPAPNMARMADGGITGYDMNPDNDGSLVYNNEPVLRMAGGGVARYAGQGDSLVRTTTGGKSWFLDVPDTIRDPSVSWYREIPNPAAAALKGKQFASREEAVAAYDRANAFPTGTQAATASKFGDYGPSAYATPPLDTSTASTAGTGGAPRTGGPAAQPQLSAPSFAGLDVAKMTRSALDEASKAPNPFAKDVEDIGSEKVKAKEEEVKGLEAIHKQFSDIYKGKRERLDTREGEIGKLKDQQMGLALLEAAATIGSTGGNTGMALTKGLGAFGRSYGAGMEKVQAAKDKITEARDRLEELEAQRGEMSARELFKARSDVKNTMVGAKEDLLKANMQMYGVNRETAMKIVDNQVKVGIASLEQQGATARANMANRNPTLELLQAVQRDPSLAQAYQAMHGTKNDMMTQYIDFLGKNPAGSIEDFLKTKAVFSTLGGMSAKPVTQLPPGATVAPR